MSAAHRAQWSGAVKRGDQAMAHSSSASWVCRSLSYKQMTAGRMIWCS